MNFLLDTNLVSEPMRPRPNAGVLKWLHEVNEDSTFVSVVTITELRYGVQRLPTSVRRERLDDWLDNEFRLRFEGRILAISAEVADTCGRLMARSESLGHPIESRDAFIAATAEVHRLTLVTHNASDFQPTVKDILTPWN